MIKIFENVYVLGMCEGQNFFCIEVKFKFGPKGPSENHDDVIDDQKCVCVGSAMEVLA